MSGNKKPAKYDANVRAKDEFCDRLVDFTSKVHAAVVAFATAIGYDYFLHSSGEVDGNSWGFAGRLFLCAGSLCYVVDDWFGSRRLISRMRARAHLGRRQAQSRFTVDLLIAIVAYFIMMSAIRGSRATGLFLAISLSLGAVWAYLCIRGSGIERGRILADMRGVVLSHAVGALVIVVYFLARYGRNWAKWVSEVTDPWTASVLVFGALVLYRFAFPWTWRRFLWTLQEEES